MSTIVVTPPATAARVAEAKPSHSVRPGSLTCTWLSTRPGSSTSSSARVTASGRGVVEGGDGGDPAVRRCARRRRARRRAGPPGARGRRGRSCRHPARTRRERGRGPRRPGAARRPTPSSPSRRAAAAGRRPPRSGPSAASVADVHRGCIGPRGHRWQPGGLARARARPWCAAADGRPARRGSVPVQRPGSSPVRPSSTCSVAVSDAGRAQLGGQLGEVVRRRAATTVGSRREVERARRRSR